MWGLPVTAGGRRREARSLGPAAHGEPEEKLRERIRKKQGAKKELSHGKKLPEYRGRACGALPHTASD